jgi:hypothetical protein
MVTATWRTKTLTVDAQKILSWRNITMKTGVASEEKKTGAEAYKSMKNESAAELSIDIPLSSVYGIDVGNEVESWIALSRDGGSGRFYVGTNDFLGVNMMLESCEVKSLELIGNGIAKSCELSLKFVQANSRNPVKPSNPTNQTASQIAAAKLWKAISNPGATITNATNTVVKTVVSTAVKGMTALIDLAKKVSATSVVKKSTAKPAPIVKGKTNIKTLFK